MKITIKEIAKLAGVSISTVSKILNNYDDVSEETKQRVMKIIEEHRYQPSFSSRASAAKKSNLIGVIYAGKVNAEFNHLFFIDVINSFKKRIGLLGYDLIFFSNEKFHSAGEDYLARCNYYQVDGCVLINGNELEPSISELDQSDIPCIGIDLELKGKRSGFIMSDNSKIAYKVVEQFYLQGYKEIGFLGATMSPISKMREESFKQAMQNFGLTINDNWFANGSDFFEESGYTAMSSILQQGPPPTALFAASDLLAIGAMRALKEHGYSTPHDVAIIGCDDIEACKYIDPPLTTVRQDKEKIGLLAALMLFDLINNQLSSSSVMVEPELIIRQTCNLQVEPL
ncbi:LacI family DNA-binding transcriptional regulator [Paenibacillus athensensis]|uniref:LacI family DNA-binding transcriptional regulator n=1 Tax=Paenibacillus athensensis TaxID=1967502 RepID=UPI001ADD8B9D|nr:LacI family DNA-binding transcriptional regulator [Paenibacillus athensensis]MCD1261294.1 LacI family DNA-binding transcriptional regulator [Paenibacillus athensensis]